MVYFKALTRNSALESEENNEKPQLESVNKSFLVLVLGLQYDTPFDIRFVAVSAINEHQDQSCILK
jgi:hypothetical protein